MFQLYTTGKSDLEFCTWLATEVKLVAVPLSAFYAGEPAGAGAGGRRTLVRFALCKKRETIEAAVAAVEAHLLREA